METSDGDLRFQDYTLRANPQTCHVEWNFWADWKAYKLDATEELPAGGSSSSRISNAVARQGWEK